MGRTPNYLPRLLLAAEHTCTASELATVFSLTVNNATSILRYYERGGFVVPDYTRVRTARFREGGRMRARYRLTWKGTEALARQREAEADHDGRALADAWRATA